MLDWRGLPPAVRCVAGVSLLLALGVPSARAQSPRQLVATATDQHIVMDGYLEESAWAQAQVSSGFVQAEPREGHPATERTEVRVLYDADSLYFGVFCFHSEPGSIIVTDLARDFAITDTDVFGISLDTVHDRRNTFVFFTNPGGAQRDEQSFDDGRFLNLNWDGIWEVATSIGPEGWTAEIRIPFKTLRADGATDSFGVNFFRSIRHKNEQAYWNPVPRAFSIHRASLAGDLVGLNGIRAGRSLRIKPGLVTRFERVVAPPAETRLKPDVSLDAKYGVTRGLTLDLTLRPDFSQAEVDTEQVNLTRFNLFFPEKRDFFLENEGFFHFGDLQGERGVSQQGLTRLFHSRHIGLSDANRPIPILGGARVSGRAGAYTVGALNLQQEESDGTPATNFSVVRIRRHLLSNSDVGVIYVGREATGDYNRAYGADANFQFHQHLTTSLYLARTDGPDLSGNNVSKKGSIQWRDSFKMLQFLYEDTGESFEPETGFVERVGHRHYRAQIELNPVLESSRLIRGFQIKTNFRYWTDQSNRKLARDDHYNWTFNFHDGSRISLITNRWFERLDAPFEIRRGVVIPPGGYPFDEYRVNYNTNRSKPLSMSIVARRGTFYDGHLTNVSTNVYLLKGSRLSARLSHNMNKADLAAGSFDASVAGLTVAYSFSPRAFLSAFVQYNSDVDRWITNIRFRLIHRPLSDVYLVYTEENPAGRPQYSRAFLFKYTYAFEF